MAIWAALSRRAQLLARTCKISWLLALAELHRLASWTRTAGVGVGLGFSRIDLEQDGQAKAATAARQALQGEGSEWIWGR